MDTSHLKVLTIDVTCGYTMCTCEYIILSIYDGGLPISSGEGILKEGADGPPSVHRLGWEPAGPWGCPGPAELPKASHSGRTWPGSRRDRSSKDSSRAARPLRLMSQIGPGQNWPAGFYMSFCRKGCTKKMAARPCQGPRWLKRPPRAGP